MGHFERCKELKVPLESGECFGEVFACFKRTMVSPTNNVIGEKYVKYCVENTRGNKEND